MSGEEWWYEFENALLSTTRNNSNIINLLNDRRYNNITDGNSTIQRALVRSCDVGNVDVLRHVLKYKQVEPDANDSVVLYQACRSGFTDMVRILLEDGRANPADDMSIALSIACGRGHLDIVMLLLNDGRAYFDTDIHGIRDAITNGHIAVLEILVRHGNVMRHRGLFTKEHRLFLTQLALKIHNDIKVKCQMISNMERPLPSSDLLFDMFGTLKFSLTKLDNNNRWVMKSNNDFIREIDNMTFTNRRRYK
jgi:ankyrin repeat protein